MARVLLLDNYDSYTYNLAHLLATANSSVAPTVIRADAYPSIAALEHVHGSFDAYVLSPGPGSPHCDADFPQLPRDVLAQNAVPVWGVCLGHQALCVAFGARVVRAPEGPVHGVVSRVMREGDCDVLRGLPPSFQVVRYHSLAVESVSMTHALVPTAWAGGETRALMAVRHVRFPLFGVQFHPESVCTEFGARMASNFMRVTRACMRPSPWAEGVLRAGHAVQKISAGPAQRKEHFRVIVRSLSAASIDSADLFKALYGNEPVSFWLDSSSTTVPQSSMSRCSSPALSMSSQDSVPEMSDDGVNCAGDQTAPRAAEGAPDARRGRFSIMGALGGPRSELVTYDVTEKCVLVTRGQDRGVERHYGCNIFDFLDARLEERHVAHDGLLPIEMNGGYVGFFGYELKADVDGVRPNVYRSSLPDAWFVFADRVIVFDHEEDIVFLVAVIGNSDRGAEVTSSEAWFASVKYAMDGVSVQSPAQQLFSSSGQFSKSLCFDLERRRASYLRDIGECLREINAGESYEVCLTNRLRTRFPEGYHGDALDIYCALRLANPAPYSAFLRLSPDTAVCCSSPERFLSISAGGRVESKPIKGTLPRGASPEEDQKLRDQLASSVKDRSENLMIVDLVRNDLSRTCAIGSVTVPRLMHVESYATVHQLVSTVRGCLRDGMSTIDCIRAAYPMGSMSGAPKVRTLEIIDRLEHSARGVYSGSIGFLSLSGAADFNVVIRTAVIQGHQVEIGVGGAIVALSNPEEEYEEVLLKGAALMQSLALTSTGKSWYRIASGVGGAFDNQKCLTETRIQAACP